MSDMTLAETTERWNESLKAASSRCRELGAAQGKTEWLDIASHIDGLRNKGMTMIKAKSMSREEILKIVDERQKTLKIN